MMSAGKIHTANGCEPGVICVCLCVCVCVCVCCECMSAQSPGERASAEWFKHWQELKINAIYKL